ncbi:hypothetical protein IAQ61_004463 [Plenodomus lingam]|uniref:uncharacterized protein n=1 Tax=Leptosphaeria maculans TaxID=5022 RepID=UPI003321329B|nr:hypothetical protein IAQ61_004463 [Plenodomus lingam]
MARATRAKPPRMEQERPVNKVIKRPARGYHKFRNGILNVKPKGGEKAITKTNQSSPLLRLPAEIRNKIWALSLGGQVMRLLGSVPNGSRRVIALSSTERSGVALLRVCRQIYAEAAGMPLSLNTFSYYQHPAVSLFKYFKPHQRKQITSVRADLDGITFETSGGLDLDWTRRLFEFLPALKTYRLCVFKEDTTSPANSHKGGVIERIVYKRIKSLALGAAINFGVEYIAQDLRTFNSEWHSKVHRNTVAGGTLSNPGPSDG